MINYKILHVPTGYYVYPEMSLPTPRMAIEVLTQWHDNFYEDPPEDMSEVGFEFIPNLFINVGSPGLYEEYRQKGLIPDIKEFEIIVEQT
jgi:hypothetical protein